MTLLKSLKLLKYKFKVNFRLYLIGKGYNFNLLSNFIKNSGLQKNIKLAGYKKNAFEYIKSSDLLILTSRYEGLPNVLIEAQASGVPVISSNCPSGPREILMNGKLGELFKVGDYKGLSKKILDEIEGIYTIAAIHVDNPEQIVSVRNETPLVIGLGNEENYVASDIYAILKYTQQIIYPDDQ